jgi:hypothetical protein
MKHTAKIILGTAAALALGTSVALSCEFHKKTTTSQLQTPITKPLTTAQAPTSSSIVKQ